MFIETLEFTIPVDLCDVFSALKEGPRCNLEFPASVNSYGTTQDASIQVALRANKLTFTVDGVSSNSSMISKSECKTLKLAVFDVDRSLIAQECESSQAISGSSKRTLECSNSAVSHSKISRSSYSDNYQYSPQHTRNHNNSQSSRNVRSPKNSPVNVKEEPEDLDLIEIEPDAELSSETKTEIPFMQVEYSSTGPTSLSGSERVSFPTSSFRQNVPHVPDYAEPGPSHHSDKQSADDYLVYQDDVDYADDNSADISNEGNRGITGNDLYYNYNVGSNDNVSADDNLKQSWPCEKCPEVCRSRSALWNHKKVVHENQSFKCVCGKVYSYNSSLQYHKKFCNVLNAFSRRVEDYLD